jgi:hypothetical protein
MTPQKKEMLIPKHLPLNFCGTPVLLRHLFRQDAKSRTSGAGFIDMLRINSNPPSAGFAALSPPEADFG